MKQYDKRSLSTLALSDGVRSSINDTLRKDPGNPLALALLGLLPDDTAEFEEFSTSLTERSVEELDGLLKIAPMSFLRFEVTTALIDKKKEE